jgi:hypothetical protein
MGVSGVSMLRLFLLLLLVSVLVIEAEAKNDRERERAHEGGQARRFDASRLLS